MTEDKLLLELAKECLLDGNTDTYTALLNIKFELTALRVIAQTVARMYQNGDDAAWQGMFEALADAGILPEYGDLVECKNKLERIRDLINDGDAPNLGNLSNDSLVDRHYLAITNIVEGQD